MVDKHLKSRIHGLRVKIGLKKSWMNRCIKNDRLSNAAATQKEIDMLNEKLNKLLSLITPHNEQHNN